ncbi:MAG: helix-turn-helix domain-containing protein [Candidatus Thiodiazotropha lotti]|nr:helix-turn-helix domain-containing protein [Candidatus Thiodiazotropha lotti]MCW4188300.1 helix-turn-helix domain-containing protein [Candidatus Thiodiazotropha lotti]
MEIGEVVKLLRKQAGYTQEKVAMNIPGYDGANLSRFERGRQSIDLDKLKIIAATLNMSLSDIFAIAESDIPYLQTGKSDPKQINSDQSQLSTELNELISHYTRADQRGRDSILSIARIQNDKLLIKNLPKSHDGDALTPTGSKRKKANNQ